MAVHAVVKSAKAGMILSTGTNPDTGKEITATVSLTGLNGEADPAAIMNVVDAAAPCLAYEVARVEYTVVKTLNKY